MAEIQERMCPDPVILGPSHGDECERCLSEPAEYRVRTFEFGHRDPRNPMDWDFCGTCYLLWLADARRTPVESMHFWETYHDGRDDD